MQRMVHLCNAWCNSSLPRNLSSLKFLCNRIGMALGGIVSTGLFTVYGAIHPAQVPLTTGLSWPAAASP